MNNLELSSSIFENIKHIDEFGNEYWSARELGKILKYGEYRNFLPVIEKAITTCKNSNQKIDDHFVQTDVMVGIGSKAKRLIYMNNLLRSTGCQKEIIILRLIYKILN